MRFSLLLVLILAGCARPDYVSNGNPTKPPSEKDTWQERCGAQLASSGACVQLIWETYPTEKDFGAFVVKFLRPNVFDQSQVPVEALDLEIFLWMPRMGHGSSPVKIERLDVGTYRASKVFFSMRGDWDIHVRARMGDKAGDEAILPIHF